MATGHFPIGGHRPGGRDVSELDNPLAFVDGEVFVEEGKTDSLGDFGTLEDVAATRVSTLEGSSLFVSGCTGAQQGRIVAPKQQGAPQAPCSTRSECQGC